MDRLLNTLQYAWIDQEAFARLSGDFNPLHMDRTAGRREFFGEVVVHGVHGLLRALDAWCAERGAALTLTRLRATFPDPIHLETPVQLWLAEQDEGCARLRAESAGRTVLQLEIAWSPSEALAAPVPQPSPAAPRAEPEELAFDALAGRCGELPLWLDPDALRQCFPSASAALPPVQLAQILACTRLVGMHCPGLRSVFLGLRLDFTGPSAASAEAIRYRVERALRAASLVQLSIAGAGMTGALDALVRPAPQAQADLATVRRRTRDGEFAGQVALVVGGSRGLGEVSAKLIAAGGGRVALTYARGRDDAERVAAALREAGPRCDVLHCDVAAPESLASALRAIELTPTHLYYFASPKIFVKRGGGFDPSLFARFRTAYVDGFESVIRACRSAGAGRLRTFYPSSIAIEERTKNLEEYVAAKLEGEKRCAELAQADPLLEITVKRLPRIATDQTTTFVKHPAADALDVMTEVVREMNEPRGTGSVTAPLGGGPGSGRGARA
jgi:hypothetical protein